MGLPFDNEYPINRHVCVVCGGAFGFQSLDEGAAYRVFLSDHRLCRILEIPSAPCVVDDCKNTAIGPAQRCKAHGGTRRGPDRRVLHGR